MLTKPVILVVGGEASERQSFVRALNEQFRVVGAEQPDDAVVHLDGSIDLVICDLQSREFSGVELLQMWKRQRPDTPFVVVTEGLDVNAVILAMKLGAADCLVKPVDAHELGELVAEVLEDKFVTGQSGELSPVGTDTLYKKSFEIPPGMTLSKLEREAILQALARSEGNRTRAAQELGISVRTLQRKLKSWSTPIQPLQSPVPKSRLLLHSINSIIPFTAHAQVH
jgi:DNA-binding NtrC family response regulator